MVQKFDVLWELLNLENIVLIKFLQFLSMPVQDNKHSQNLSEFQNSVIDLSKIADLSPNLLFILDLQEPKIIYINKRVHDLLGLKPEFVYEQGPAIFKIIFHPDDYARRQSIMEKERNLEDQEENEVEVRLKTAKSGWQWFRITEKVFKRKDDGTVVHLIGTAQNIHEQKVSEEKLQEEHRRFKNAQAIGHIGSYERKLPGNRIYCSEEFFRIHGRESVSREVDIKEFVSYVHPDDQKSFWAAIDHTHNTGESLDLITRIIRPDGSIRHVHRRSALILNEDGVPLRVYGTVQDITERIKAEEERKKSESLMRSTEIVAGTGSYEVHVLSDQVYFSEGLYRLFGEEPGSFIPSWDWVASRSHPDDTEKVQQILNRAVANKEPYTYRRRIYRKDGEMRIFQAQGNIVTDPEGKPLKVIGLVQDITERQKAEEELRRSEERSRNLLKVLQNAPDAYLVLTPDFHIKIASDAYLKATLTQREQIIGQNIFQAFPDNPKVLNATGVKNLRASLDAVLSTKKPHRMAMQHYDVQGHDGSYETKYWSPTNTPVLSGNGEIEYIIHRVIDITEVIKKQADVKGLANETEILKTSLEEIRHQAQQLKESREMLQTIFDASPNSIILYKTIYTGEGDVADFEFLMVNAYDHNLIGVTNNLIGKRFSSEFPPAVKTELLGEFKRTVETGIQADFEVRYDNDDQVHWFHFRATKLNDLLVVTGEDITRRKHSERELLRLKDELAQRAKVRYRKIINSMDDGFCLIEVIFNEFNECIDYKFLDTNPVFEKHAGLKDVVGKKISELIPGIEPFWKEVFGRVAITGKSLRLERQVEDLGRWLEGYTFRIGPPKEKQVALIFRNITERKEAERRQDFFIKLNDALQSYTKPAEIKRIAMQMLGEHLEVDRAHYAEALADDDTFLIIPGYIQGVAPMPRQIKISDIDPVMRKKYLTGEVLVINDSEEELQDTPGLKAAVAKFQVRALIGVPLIKEKRLIAMVGIHQSTPRRWKPEEIDLVKELCERIWAAGEKNRVELALRESEQRFRNLVEASALAVWETNPDGFIVEDSPSWRAFTGQTPEEAMGAGWLKALHPDDRENAWRNWEEAIVSGKNVDMEFRLQDAAGNYRWVNVKATPISNTEGKITKWSGMNLDIHDRKQAEEALLKAKEEAEAASRAKEDFVSTMSHEIRTPLNAVIGFTNLLLEQNPREDQKENLQSLNFSAGNLLTLINEILDFSKLEAGKVKLAENQFNLQDLLDNLKDAHQQQALANQTQIKLHLDEEIPRFIVTDQLKLSQVLHNLVSNAVKFTEKGKVKIAVELNDRDEDILWLDFSIIDTGVGIATDKLDYIFEKFSQADHPNLQNYGGTGLGLSITKLLLDLMGGEIEVESEVGKGSRFYFSLPVKIAREEHPEEPISRVQEEVQDLSHLRLMLVEDVEINREIVLQFLENWWHVKPDEAVNGKEAVEMAKNKDYDLILMDVRMPVMDGYEATKEIRKLPGYQNIPILALTADKSQEIQQAQNTTRFTDLLTKPFDPRILKQRILHHLSVSSKVPSDTSEKENDEIAKNGKNLMEQSGKQLSIDSSEPAFEISRFTKMAGNKEEILKKWIKSSITAFETYRDEFSAATQEEKEVKQQNLSDLVHKNTSTVFYVQANSLAERIETYRQIIESPNITTKNFKDLEKEVLGKFDEVIQGLKSLYEKEL